MVKEAISRWQVPITVGTLCSMVLFIIYTTIAATKAKTVAETAIEANRMAIVEMKGDIAECHRQERNFESTLIEQGSDLKYIKEALAELKDLIRKKHHMGS